MRRELLAVERRTLLDLPDRGDVNDEAPRRSQCELGRDTMRLRMVTQLRGSAWSGPFHADESKKILILSKLVSLLPNWLAQTKSRVVTIQGDT